MRSSINQILHGKSKPIYEEILEFASFTIPHEFVGDRFRFYSDQFPSNPAINGRIFEYLICETLVREGITPFYYQARLAHVPNADFDVVLYHPTKPVVLTLKVSLRERYKQADLEGMVLRQVYRGATIFLVTLSEDEAQGIKRKIDDGDVVGLDDCVIASDWEYTRLLKTLKGMEFQCATPVVPIAGQAVGAHDQ